MPWKIEQRDGEHCVIKEDDGEVEGCHADRPKAVAQLAALNASEEKEVVESLTAELSQRVTVAKSKISILDRIKARLRKEIEPEKPKQKGLMVFKSGDTFRWATIYSNAYRDRDNPAEIISKAAHEDFVRAVDAGEWPMPVLEWWHVADAPLGQADLVFWDKSTNCAWAAGDFTNKDIAQAFANSSADLGVSHGMPQSEIKREDSDPTVITRYRSKEISLLPARVAANPLTGLYSKEMKMATQDEKLAELQQATGLDPSALGEKKKAEAEALGLESKDTDAPEAPVPAVTAEDIAAALQAVITPIAQKIAELEGELKALKESPPELPAPGASILEAMGALSVVGKKEAQVDGRTARHEGPTETKAQPGDAQFGNFMVDNIVGPLLNGEFANTMNERSGVAQ